MKHLVLFNNIIKITLIVSAFVRLWKKKIENIKIKG